MYGVFGVAEAHNKLCYFITEAAILHVEGKIRKKFFLPAHGNDYEVFFVPAHFSAEILVENLFNGLLLFGSVRLFLVFSGTFFLSIYNQKHTLSIIMLAIKQIK